MKRAYLTFLWAIMLITSCNSDNTGSSDLTDWSKEQDSIRRAELLEINLAKEDSIKSTKIKSYSVKRIEGKHKYGGVTKVQYNSLAQLLNQAHSDAKKEMWTKEDLEEKIFLYKKFYKGGQIRLDIERSTIGAANTDMFTVIIKDSAENEIYRKDLESDIPEHSTNNWWNIELIYLEQRISTPFYVYVVDRLEDAPFKFVVTAVPK